MSDRTIWGSAALAAVMILCATGLARAAGQEVGMPMGVGGPLPGPVVPLLEQGDEPFPPGPPDRLAEPGRPAPGPAFGPGRLPPPPFMVAAPPPPPPPGLGLDALLLAPKSEAQVLDTAEARRRLEHVLAGGNPALKVGAVTEKNEDTLVADIVTAEGSGLVRRLAIDRHTWLMRAVD